MGLTLNDRFANVYNLRKAGYNQAVEEINIGSKDLLMKLQVDAGDAFAEIVDYLDTEYCVNHVNRAGIEFHLPGHRQILLTQDKSPYKRPVYYVRRGQTFTGYRVLSLALAHASYEALPQTFRELVGSLLWRLGVVITEEIPCDV